MTVVVGIVNVTPDSFSDGGLYLDPHKAVRHALNLIDVGADWIDIGAESTRPGAEALQPEEEWQRLEPVLAKLSQGNDPVTISLDTRHDENMLRALDYGVRIINNVSGLAKADTLRTLAKSSDLSYVAMHMHRQPETMQSDPLDEQACDEVETFFARAFDELSSAGFDKNKIWLDPGIGFGKTDRANLRLLRGCQTWSKKYQVFIGVSRKSMIGRLLGIEKAQARDPATKMLEFGLMTAGVQAIRTHDVATLVRIKRLLG